MSQKFIDWQDIEYRSWRDQIDYCNQQRFDASLSSILAHSAVFFSREEWLPVADARGDGKNTAHTTQEETNEQTAGQGGGAGSVTRVSGTGAGSGSEGSIVLGAGSTTSFGRQSGGVGNVDITTVTTSDPDVTEAALASNVAVTGAALASNTDVTNHALDDLESGAVASINAGVAETQLNDQFGEHALDVAANAEASATTALEAMGTESETTADNALAAAQNETLAGVTPAQLFQAVEPNTPGTIISQAKLTTLATWIAVISGLFAIYYYVVKKKA